jgi:hypothetical protein
MEGGKKNRGKPRFLFNRDSFLDKGRYFSSFFTWFLQIVHFPKSTTNMTSGNN